MICLTRLFWGIFRMGMGREVWFGQERGGRRLRVGWRWKSNESAKERFWNLGTAMRTWLEIMLWSCPGCLGLLAWKLSESLYLPAVASAKLICQGVYCCFGSWWWRRLDGNYIEVFWYGMVSEFGSGSCTWCEGFIRTPQALDEADGSRHLPTDISSLSVRDQV